MVDQKIISEMMSLFENIDRRTEEFSGQTGLKCKKGCGACCTNPEIETTVAEMLPLAVHLWSKNLAQSKLELLQAPPSKSICIFYEPDLQNGPGPLSSRDQVRLQGRCGIYPYRPGLCRLFGFTARKDKHGQPALMTCKVIKDSQPQECQNTQEKLQKGLEAPLMSTHSFSVSAIDPVHGVKLLPINQAIRLALEKVGFSMEKSQQ